jgi:glycosyltransferase involved in cell wall biosynthesis
MKILLVHNSYQQHGGEDVVFQQEKELLQGGGHEVITYEKNNQDALQEANHSKVLLGARTIWAVSSRKEFRSILRQHKPDIVHVHNTFVMISPSIYSACKEEGVPVVQTLHNYRLICPAATLFRDGRICEECVGGGIWRGVLHGCYRDSRAATATVALMLTTHRLLGTWEQLIDHYIALTEFARQKFVAAGLPEEKISVKPNFVPSDPGERSTLGRFALFVGSLSDAKGVWALLHAWQTNRLSIPLRIVGDGPLKEELVNFAQRNQLVNVSFTGQLPHSRVLSLMKKARCLIFPSEWYEPFGLTLLEAFACGLPVISSGIESLRELVRPEDTGLVFTAGNSQDLADKVHWAWDHPAEMRAIGKNARAEYRLKYTAEQNYTSLMNIYERTLHTRSMAHQLTA